MLELRAVARLNAAALRSNLRRVCAWAPGQRVLAMVKADAYGHGAVWAAATLLKESRVAALGVATLAEGIELREGLGSKVARMPVIVFSGATPWSLGGAGRELGPLFERHQLTAVISSIEDWRSFHGSSSRSWSRRIPFELKFNTGMNRLGIDLQHLAEVRRDLVALRQRGIVPGGIFSHLAVGEDASHPCSRRQCEGFEVIFRELSSILPDSVDFHLANSAAASDAEAWRPARVTRRIRPGLALYGIAPEGSANNAGLTPVLTLQAPVIQVRRVRPEDSVGYGAWYRARRSGRVAILGIGYADGILRAWGHRDSGARVRMGGRGRSFTGPISMDLCAVEADSKTRCGDWATLWGEGIDPWKQATSAGTIPYEILTSLSRRVQRVYVRS